EESLREQQQKEDTAWKAVMEQEQHQQRADNSCTFAGPLNKLQQKEELKDIAAALALPESGKKDDILEQISSHFEKHPELKSDPHFESLFNSESTHGPTNRFTSLMFPWLGHPSWPGPLVLQVPPQLL
ncbi:hypothetical protein EDB85DRAFT_1873868, partial [Lactarius pseudohatsudake]